MPRSKSSVSHKARTKKVLKRAKGFWGRSKSVYSIAKQAVVRAGAFAFAHRKQRKGDFRSLWIARINAGVRQYGISYSVFMNTLDNSGVTLNRKVLSYLACEDPQVFAQVVKMIIPGANQIGETAVS